MDVDEIMRLKNRNACRKYREAHRKQVNKYYRELQQKRAMEYRRLRDEAKNGEGNERADKS